jgi:hypothetical protein
VDFSCLARTPEFIICDHDDDDDDDGLLARLQSSKTATTHFHSHHPCKPTNRFSIEQPTFIQSLGDTIPQ